MKEKLALKYIADAREAKEIDRISIEEIGIPSVVLMEKASLSVAGCVKGQIKSEKDSVLVICGVGNNGGDGVAAGRLLWEDGVDVTVLILGQKKRISPEMQVQLKIARNLGMKILWDDCSAVDGQYEKRISAILENTGTGKVTEEYSIIVDAIFGIGLTREIVGSYREWISWINACSARIISVDIPSGIHASTGAVLGIGVRADMTVTFGVNKRGLVLYPGAGYAGQVIVSDIGFPQKALLRAVPGAYTLQQDELPKYLPVRGKRTNKGSYGRVLVIAGSPDMSGACYLASEAAYRVGCGLVRVITARENTQVIRTKLPEAIVTAYSPGLSDEEMKTVHQALNWATSIVIGPGIGKNPDAEKLLRLVLEEQQNKVVIDADGLNLLAEMEEYFVSDAGKSRQIALSERFILTPHLKEMSRLLRRPVEEIAATVAETAKNSTTGCTMVLKDARTVVSDGTQVYINTTGNNALAKGGSGDVLSGMIGGLLAQGMEPFPAAQLAVCIHGLAADYYVQENGQYGMLASDLLAAIPKVLALHTKDIGLNTEWRK